MSASERLLMAVPNVSEGRDRELIVRLEAAFARGAELLDAHSDLDHNRTVLTLAGTGRRLGESLLAGATETVSAIDMRNREGAHPCIGALDVCPVVWVDPDGREAALALAREVAEHIAADFAVPVFFYGALASSEERRERAFFRRGGLVELTSRMAAGELQPDLGPPAPHPAAGATLVAARPPLVAFNVELDTPDVEVARAIAGSLRESGGGLAGVRAIGIALTKARAQVSVNVEDPFAVSLGRVVREVESLAAAHGAAPLEAELVGLAPAAALEGYPENVPIAGFDPYRDLIESRLAVFERP